VDQGEIVEEAPALELAYGVVAGLALQVHHYYLGDLTLNSFC